MIVDLNNLPAWKCFEVVSYCWGNSIEIEKCLNYVCGLYSDHDLEFDIPDEHITWMIMKGYFNEQDHRILW